MYFFDDRQFLRTMIIKPNKGAQELFLQSPAYFAIYGGGRGGGKTWALLFEFLRYAHVKNFSAVIFRKSYPQIEASGGLWDKSLELFPHAGGIPTRSDFRWNFPSGASCRFRHLSEEKHLLNWQGSEVAYFGFDELTHFDWKTINTLFAANRSTCGVKPFMRGTCNPDANSWVATFIKPWLGDDGYPDKSRSGKLAYFDIQSDGVNWRSPNESEELLSATFVPALVWDNPKLLEKDSSYVQRLRSMSMVERERFLMGNWKIKPEAGTVFKRQWFTVGNPPQVESGDRLIRYWDLAATTQRNVGKGDFTVGLLLHFHKRSNTYWVKDLIRTRIPPAKTNALILQTARQDSPMVSIRWQQEGGAAGVRDSHHLKELLNGYDTRGEIELRDKVSRALPCSYLAESGRLAIAEAFWNKDFFTEIELFPDKANDDIVDALSGAYNSISVPTPVDSRVRL